MKILILGGYEFEPKVELSYQSLRIIEEAKKRNIDIDIFDQFQIKIEISKGKALIFLGGAEMQKNIYDYVIFRDSFTDFDLFHSLVTIFSKQYQLPILNQASYELISDNFYKLTQMTLLNTAGLAIPDTYSYASSEELLTNINENMIVKPNIGSKGKGIFLGSKPTMLKELESNKAQNFILQEMLPGKEDMRVIVIGDKVMGIMKRKAAGDKIITNYSAGGSVEKFENKEIEELALQAAKVLKCEYSGVDIMLDHQGKPRILEVNRNCAFAGFEKAVGVNVAAEILDYVSNKLH